jgi:hypothetical protein
MVVRAGDPGGFVQFYDACKCSALLPFSHIMCRIVHKRAFGFWVHDFRIAAPHEIGAAEDASYP